MGLADRREAAVAATKPGAKCRWARIVDSLTEADRATLTEWMNDPNMRGTAIAEALIADGHDVTDFIVRWHRRGKCRTCR